MMCTNSYNLQYKYICDDDDDDNTLNVNDIPKLFPLLLNIPPKIMILPLKSK